VTPALPRVSGRQVVWALSRAGFEHVVTRGSHATLRRCCSETGAGGPVSDKKLGQRGPVTIRRICGILSADFHQSKKRGCMQKHKKLFVIAAIGAALVFGLATAAVAETYGVDDPLYSGRQAVAVGTNGSDASAQRIAISQGGCAGDGEIGVAVGESGRQCHEGQGNLVGIGLGSADAGSRLLAVAPDGDATSHCFGFFLPGCLAPSFSVSVLGNARAANDESNTGWGVAVSGTGNATAESSLSGAVSGTGTATAPCEQYHYMTVAVSGTNDASGCTAVSGTGHASGTTAVGGGDILP
jgi:hypothetical protein